MVLEAKVHSANVADRDGIESLLERAKERFPRLSHLWLDGGYKGKSKEWIEKALGWTVEVVQRSRFCSRRYGLGRLNLLYRPELRL